ncbi:MAG: CPBP family intramembrane glutamic endopeptidase [Streptosporangiaceae bacterium]
MTAGTRRPRNPPSAGTEAAASAATLAYNVAISQVTSGIGYVMANDSAAVLSVAAARTCGVSWASLGVRPDRLGRGIRIGLTTALLAAAVVGLGAVVPATRGFFHDERARGGGTRHVLFETLMRIPLGTALPEEVIFRGSLLGLFTQRHSPAVAASMSSILFGVWHVLPTLRTLPLNPAGARVHGNPMRAVGVVLATVTATTLAGYGLAWLRFRSGSIAAPLVAHASLNGAAYLAARFVIDATALQPGRHG